MKTKNIVLFILIHSTAILMAQSNDSVVMYVNKVPVYVTEFKNVYNKNVASISSEQKNVEDYINLYSMFKMKVMEAKMLGLDTAFKFRNELLGYRKQLAAPYLTDSSTTEKLILEAYERLKYELNVAHILVKVPETALPKDTLEAYKRIMLYRIVIIGQKITPEQLADYEKTLNASSYKLTNKSTKSDTAAYRQKIDLIKSFNQTLIAGSDNFNNYVAKTSEEAGAADRKGSIGYFTVFQMVYPFENAAYNLNINEISQPVRSRFGYHILKLLDKRVNRGEVLVEHIMLKFNAPTSKATFDTVLKKRIFDIYKKIQIGEKFEILATELSDDKQTSVNGGLLSWFGSGKMPLDFETQAFALKNNNDISEPFTSPYGWHIIKRIDKKEIAPYKNMHTELRTKVNKDQRSRAGQLSKIEQIKKQNNFKDNFDAQKEFISVLDSSIFKGTWEAKKSIKLQNKPLFTLGNKKYTQQDLSKYIETHQSPRPILDFNYVFQQIYKYWQNEQIIAFEDEQLEQKYPAFKKLYLEYHDGILLFDLSEKQIWGKAIKDTVAIKEYHSKVNNNYMWPERAATTTYKCVDEKTAKMVVKLLMQNSSEAAILKALNKDGKTIITTENNTYVKGENPKMDANWKNGIIPNLNSTDNPKTSVTFVYNLLPKQPKTFDEVKGLISIDFQTHLEEEWLKYLKNKYPVTINQQVVNSIK